IAVAPGGDPDRRPPGAELLLRMAGLLPGADGARDPPGAASAAADAPARDDRPQLRRLRALSRPRVLARPGRRERAALPSRPALPLVVDGNVLPPGLRADRGPGVGASLHAAADARRSPRGRRRVFQGDPGGGAADPAVLAADPGRGPLSPDLHRARVLRVPRRR